MEQPKFVPLSLLENNNYGGVDLERASRFGVKVNGKPDEFVRASQLNPAPVNNQRSVLAGLATVKTDFPTNPLDVRVGVANDNPRAVWGIETPERLPTGARKVSIRNKDDVEEAKAVLTQMRKNRISEWLPETE